MIVGGDDGGRWNQTEQMSGEDSAEWYLGEYEKFCRVVGGCTGSEQKSKI